MKLSFLILSVLINSAVSLNVECPPCIFSNKMFLTVNWTLVDHFGSNPYPNGFCSSSQTMLNSTHSTCCCFFKVAPTTTIPPNLLCPICKYSYDGNYTFPAGSNLGISGGCGPNNRLVQDDSVDPLLCCCELPQAERPTTSTTTLRPTTTTPRPTTTTRRPTTLPPYNWLTLAVPAYQSGVTFLKTSTKTSYVGFGTYKTLGAARIDAKGRCWVYKIDKEYPGTDCVYLKDQPGKFSWVRTRTGTNLPNIVLYKTFPVGRLRFSNGDVFIGVIKNGVLYYNSATATSYEALVFTP